MMRKYRFIILPCVILLSLFSFSCSEDEPVSLEVFQKTVCGKYFTKESGKWLAQTENGLQELEVGDGVGSIATGCFWFLDENTLLVPALLSYRPSELDELVSKWRWYLYEKGEELVLFVKSGFHYDLSSGRLSTDKQVLFGEKEGNLYSIEQISDKQIVLRTDFCEPRFHDRVGYRFICKERLSPDLSPDFPYKVFDSNEEAIAYVKEVLGE